MSFLYPEFLYYMLPPLFVLFGFILTQQESQADFFSKEVMDKLRVTSNAMTLQARNALFLFAAFLMIIALANPVINEGEIDIKAKSSDIMIALDISDSMLAEDVYPNRLKLAKQKAIEFLKLGSDERVGVVAFAKNSYLVSPLSFDHDAVRFLLSSLSTNSLTQKGTNFMTLLDVVANSSQDKEKHLLIISDGG
ncbi:MAG: VWA domain-containing protein, partial [Campylobacterales bacterium]|nr:VWA domain-containing protein [Campylobacterales bacterium]